MSPDIHRVSYRGIIADVKREDLDNALKFLSELPKQEKDQFMQRVQSALNGFIEMAIQKKPVTSKAKQDAANDIGIWLANEMIEGRSESYRVAEQ